MRLATLLGVGFGGSKDWSGAWHDSSGRHASRTCDWDGDGLRAEEGQ